MAEGVTVVSNIIRAGPHVEDGVRLHVPLVWQIEDQRRCHLVIMTEVASSSVGLLGTSHCS